MAVGIMRPMIPGEGRFELILKEEHSRVLGKRRKALQAMRMAQERSPGVREPLFAQNPRGPGWTKWRNCW